MVKGRRDIHVEYQIRLTRVAYITVKERGWPSRIRNVTNNESWYGAED